LKPTANSAPSARPALIAAFLACGLLMAHAVMPLLFRSIVSDLSRIGVDVVALHRDDVRPQIVAFGNSVTASGIDPDALSAALPNHPLVLNLSGPVQSLAESYLYYQDLPSSVCTIVQMLIPFELSVPVPFSATKFNAYYIFGYRPTAETVSVLRDAFGEAAIEMMDDSDSAQRFRARRQLSRLLDMSYWRARISTPDVDRWATDVFFFPAHRERMSDAEVRYTIDFWAYYLRALDPDAARSKPRLTRAIIDAVRAKRRRIVWLVPPMHPAVRAAAAPEVTSAFDALLPSLHVPGTSEVLDLREAVAERDFRDGAHLMIAGAEQVTQALAKRLRAEKVCL